MNITKCPYKENLIMIYNYQVNPRQAARLSELGVASNCSDGKQVFVMIALKRKVTDADITTVRDLL